MSLHCDMLALRLIWWSIYVTYRIQKRNLIFTTDCTDTFSPASKNIFSVHKWFSHSSWSSVFFVFMNVNSFNDSPSSGSCHAVGFKTALKNISGNVQRFGPLHVPSVSFRCDETVSSLLTNGQLVWVRVVMCSSFIPPQMSSRAVPIFDIRST